MIGNAGSAAAALLHQLAQGQRRTPPGGLRVYLRARQGHLHPGKRSALAAHVRNDRRLEENQGDSCVVGNIMVVNLEPSDQYTRADVKGQWAIIM